MRLATKMFVAFWTSAQTVCAEPVPAAQVNSAPVDYYIFNQSIPSFFDDLERDTDFRFRLSSNVRGTLRNISLKGETYDILNRVSSGWGLDWYEFNEVIHVSPKADASTRVVRLGDLTPGKALDALKESGLPMDRFPARIAGQGSAVVLSGPPTFLALAEAVVEAIPKVPELVGPVIPPGPTVVERRGVDKSIVPIRAKPEENSTGEP